MVHDEWKRTWKKVTMTHYKVPSQHLHGETEEYYEKLLSEQPACGTRIESTTSLIQSRSANHSIAMFKNMIIYLCIGS
jgi:hypothetical protein